MRATAPGENQPARAPSIARDSLRSSWLRAWRALALTPPAETFDALLAAYSEPQRGYHTLQHLQECLSHLGEVLSLARHPGEVEVALWFHDAVYNPRGSANEHASAEWAVRVLTAAGASPAILKRVQGLIMATCHDAQPIEADQQLLVDIDLAILGASPQRFEEYQRQIRFEYAWVPGLVYGVKRKQVLRGFLKREQIFSTAAFLARYEAQARSNLELAVSGS